ncbi:HAMP domain-containing histidine kinase [Agrococcus terreus]|uniref:sensor histidine kinase n=1 Tax=Agrococcus terreus TaxID=574649 RepID=UPI00384B2158
MTAARRSRLRTWTVRSRIVGLLTLLSFVGLFVAGGVAYFVERERVLAQIDANLGAALESASITVANADEPWESEEAALGSVVQRLAPDDNTGTLGIIDGAPFWQPFIPPEVPLEQLPGFVDRVVAETADGEIVVGTYATDDETVRYLAAPVTIGEPDPEAPNSAIFVTGYDVQAELAEFDAAARIFTVVAVVVTIVIFLVGLLVSGLLLRPVRRIREVAERSSEQSLSERVPVTGRDDVSQLAETVNRMLDRLGGSLDAQRQLLQDVGHELKTPITIVRGHLELVDPTDARDVEETRALAIDELDRMARLVDDIRAAARLREPDAFAIVETDVEALVGQIAQKARAIEGADIDDAVRTDAVLARMDPDRITQAMLQLIANAARHAQGPITIGSRVRGADLELFVLDRGPGVPEALKTVIFDRFRRGAAEGRGDGGSGLGLAIVALIAEQHGGTAAVVDAGAGSEFQILLPRAVVGADDDQSAWVAALAEPAPPSALADPVAPPATADPAARAPHPHDPRAAARTDAEEPGWHRS